MRLMIDNTSHMKSISILVPALCLIALAGAGCTTSQVRVGNGAKLFVDSPLVAENRCDELLTMDQAKEMTGLDWKKRTANASLHSTRIFNITSCEFAGTNSEGTARRLYIEAGVMGTREKTIESYTFWKKSPDFIGVTGVGDEAIYGSKNSVIYVLSDGVRLAFTSKDIEREKLETIARVVVTRFNGSSWSKEMQEWKP